MQNNLIEEYVKKIEQTSDLFKIKNLRKEIEGKIKKGEIPPYSFNKLIEDKIFC